MLQSCASHLPIDIFMPTENLYDPRLAEIIEKGIMYRELHIYSAHIALDK